jgi:lipopolysaccharide export LptBFGC system permease protein LptF
VYSLPAMTGFILPVTFLLGIMLTFGRMAQTSELTAAKAAGVPLSRLVFPIVVMGALVSAACFVLLDQGQPWAYQRLNQLIGSELPLRVTLDAVPTGVMHEYGDWRVYVGERTPDKTLHNVIVLQDRDAGVRAFYAGTARVFRQDAVSRLEMEEVRLIEDATVTPTADSITLTLPALKTFNLEGEQQGQPLREMLSEEGQVAGEYRETGNDNTRKDLAKLRIKIGERLSFPLMCLAVSIVAAPIGARARRSGRSYTFASGVLIVAAYFILRSLLKGVHPDTLASAIVVAQIPNLVLIATGLLLIWRVDRI